MKLAKLGSLALVAALAAGSVGCVVRAHGRISGPAVVYVDEDPPPPRVVVTEVRPGFVFIQGRWTRNGNRWAWRDGYWQRQRANHVYVQGRWERRGNRRVWVDGSWRASGGVRAKPAARPATRDHRRDDRRDNGPVIRDHRR